MSSFIERFSIAGSAGVLGLMVILGMYGFARLFVAAPEEYVPPGMEKVLVLDQPIYRVQPQVVRPEASAPADPGEEPPEDPAPDETPEPADEPPIELQSLVLAAARPSGDFDVPVEPPAAAPAPAFSPAAVETPAPVPHTAPPPTPAPPPPAPPLPTPTAEATPAPEPTAPPPTPDPTAPTP
jgi:hypothetical protein